MTNFEALAATARTAAQVDLASATTDDGLVVAAYQASIREGRTYYFVQVPGLGYHAVTDLADAIEIGRGPRLGSTAPLAHKRFEADGTIVEVKADGTEKAPRPAFLDGMARRLANVEGVVKAMPRA